MSLDVYLERPGVSEARERIFIREGGGTKEVSREEWERRFPDREPIIAYDDGLDGEVYSANITHNLNKMADEAGIYKHLWRPDELGITKAKDLIGPLFDGLALLKSSPERFRAFNPPNGWGNYEGLAEFVEKYLEACRETPDADVRVSR